jgi:hypothetical protein
MTTVSTTTMPVARIAAGGSCAGEAWWAGRGAVSVVMSVPFHPLLNLP